jgi:hypothetical protein
MNHYPWHDLMVRIDLNRSGGILVCLQSRTCLYIVVCKQKILYVTCIVDLEISVFDTAALIWNLGLGHLMSTATLAAKLCWIQYNSFFFFLLRAQYTSFFDMLNFCSSLKPLWNAPPFHPIERDLALHFLLRCLFYWPSVGSGFYLWGNALYPFF